MFWIPNLFRRFPGDMLMARVPGTTCLITTTENNASVVRIAADRRRRLQRAEGTLRMQAAGQRYTRSAL